MANLLKMADMQAILALHRLGWSNRRIARELDIHRETVGDYVRQADSKPASAPTGSDGTTRLSAGTINAAFWSATTLRRMHSGTPQYLTVAPPQG